MKVVRALDEVEEAFDSAVREAVAAFGRGECFVERYLDRPRHVEAQVLADTHGNVVVVGTRDCSLQRRHQKLVEEAPAPFLSDDQTRQIYDAAKAVCREAGYSGAGTVEFLVAADGTVAFLEVNTRLQVEHPITEETTGIDLVQEQFRIAAGEPLRITADPAPRGHSFEFRLNAEDVGRGFLPSPGTVEEFHGPTGPGIRLDTGVRSGSFVPPQFDSLLAKLIVTGADRQQALRRARRALAEISITGVATVLPFHRAVLESPDFTSEARLGIHTRWIETDFADTISADPDFSTTAPDGERRTITVEVDGRRMAVGLPADLLDGWARSGGPLPAGVSVDGSLRWRSVRRRCRRRGPGGAARRHGRNRGEMARRTGRRGVGRGSRRRAGSDENGNPGFRPPRRNCNRPPRRSRRSGDGRSGPGPDRVGADGGARPHRPPHAVVHDPRRTALQLRRASPRNVEVAGSPSGPSRVTGPLVHVPPGNRPWAWP